MKDITLYIFISVLFGCCKDDLTDIVRDDTGAIIKKPTIWIANHNDGDLSLFAFGRVSPPVLYNNCILQGGEKDNLPYVWMTNIISGQSAWDENFNEISSEIRFSYQHDNYCIFNGKGGNIYNFDLSSHSVSWNSDIKVNFWIQITGLDSLFFACGYKIDESNPYLINSAWVGNVYTGEIKEIYKPDMNPINPDSVPINGVGGVERILPFKNENGDILLVINVVKYYGPPVESYLNLYNLPKNIWVYEKINIGFKNEVILGIPEVFNNKIYLTSTSEITCYDLFTGGKIWRTNYNNRFSSEGHVIADGKIFAMIDGSIKKLVCHDVNTGQQIWLIPASGTISTLNYLNGVIYFASMSDDKLYAVDANSGKYLWKIKAPDNSGLKNECAVVSGQNDEKGKVIVSTFLNGYCYEAEK